MSRLFSQFSPLPVQSGQRGRTLFSAPQQSSLYNTAAILTRFRAQRAALLCSIMTGALMLALLVVCIPYRAAAMGGHDGGSYSAGLQILTLWENGTNERIPVYVWYPCIRPERPTFLEPYTVSAAREGKPEEGKFPVILISHAAAESGLSHHTTAEYLARKGFVVVAPTHPGDNYIDTSRIFTEHQIIDRPEHVIRALEAMLAHPEIGPIADQSRIGMIGYGVGATTALMLTGAVPNTSGLRTYCSSAQAEDPYCSKWAQKRLSTLMANPDGVLAPPAGATWYDKRIKSVALIAPAYGMLFNAASFARFKVPAMILEAEKDAMNVPVFHAQHLRTLMPEQTPYFILVGATNFTLHAPCTERMTAGYPAICKDPAGTDRESILGTLHDILHRFFTNRMSN